MSQPFSSSFSALQAHFQQPDKPGQQQTHNPNGTAVPSGRNHDAYPAAEFQLHPNSVPVQPRSTPSFQPDLGRDLPTMPRYPAFGLIPEPTNQASPPRPPEMSFGNTASGITSMQSFGPPSSSVFANPPVPALSAHTPHGGEALPLDSAMADASQIMDEGEGDPMDTTTDALLERQQLLFQDNHPLPKLPRIRGLSAKHFLGETKSNQSPRRRRGDTKRRGPRKAVEPTGDIKYRLNMASNAYMDGNLDEAIRYVEDAIRINAETYRAWTMLASFLHEKKEVKQVFTAKVIAATLQPKEIDGWIQCAELGIKLADEFPEEANEFLQQAIYSYSSALRVDNKHRPARHGRAAIYSDMGRLKSAVKDYTVLVDTCPYDVYALRGLARISILIADIGAQFADRPKAAIEAYRLCVAHFRENGLDSDFPFGWEDIEMFVELLAYVEEFQEAVHELRLLSRWHLTRSDEVFWDAESDDREWDVDNIRRLGVASYQDGKYPASSYGSGLPLELRTKLAVYRLKLGEQDEAMRHLDFIDPDSSDVPDLLSDYPHLLLEGAAALYEVNNLALALRYYEPLRAPDLLDAESLVRIGRCYLDAGDKRQAEECFTAAIDQDESNSEACIDARYELAKMYEAAREEREAYILVNEAIRLQEAREQARLETNDEDDIDDDEEVDGEVAAARASRAGMETEPRAKTAKRPAKPRGERPKKESKPKAEPARRRPKVFARTEELQLEEKRRANELAEAWRAVRDAPASSETDGDSQGPPSSFMAAAQKLVDDFRSYRDFYPWDKYLAHLGLDQAREKVMARRGNRNLLAMVERLSHNLNPDDPNAERQPKQVAISYRGVPFEEWLDLFLEYAVGLAQTGRFQQAYKVCESARDAVIFSKSKENMFLIHVTWAACALRGRDEETCVAVARWLMREYQYDTDPFRMFSALSRLCLSPASWYASGPVQKYILRQIKLMDRAIGDRGSEDSGDEDEASSGRVYPSKNLDITLLMLYGFILFTSSSFTYALNYFLRAYTLDKTNGMVLLTVGHCYVHYALKRQSENRQFLLSQGFHFLHKYYNLKQSSLDAAQRQEAHFNLARSYHAIGLPHLAARFYQLALEDVPDDSANGIMGRNDLKLEAAYNLHHICWTGGDVGAVKSIAQKYLVL
ncbi:TPR-like protein [Hypoxylon sp. FL1284]|nr:TPR-like protein [Hypoxylon sp. FL1284]